MEDKVKGAFKNYPLEQQPARIPLELVPRLEKALYETFCHLGDLHFVPVAKKRGKATTGDLDVLFVPKVKTWRKHIQTHPYVVASEGNSAQLMTVMKELLGNGQQYMIDFLVVREGGLGFKKLFYGYGTAFSALLGSFARSIGYKFTDYALYRRISDRRKQWHNIELTRDPVVALAILGLESDFLYDEAIYTPEGLASWLISSPRFDSYMWKNGNPDKIAVGIPINKNARDAIKKNDETYEAYELINMVDKMSYFNVYLEYEYKYLGKHKVDQLIKEIEEETKKNCEVLSGKEIMEYLHIPPGPMVGKCKAYLDKQFANVPKDKLQDPEIKEHAKKLLTIVFEFGGERQNVTTLDNTM